jgi:hypothetical protein
VPGRDAKKLQVLILTGYNLHDWRAITESLRSTLEATGRFEVRRQRPGSRALAACCCARVSRKAFSF